MAYTRYDFKTKKALREALLDGEFISVYQPELFGPDVKDGTVSLEGPHYPKPHTWYAQGEVVNGRLIKIK
jgi:hypothetical protein